MPSKSGWNAKFKYWIKTRFNPYITRKDVAAIGEIVVIWGQIEAALQHLIWGYCGFSLHRGMAVTGGLPLQSKKTLLSTLVHHYERDPRRVATLTDTLREIDKLQAERNVIVHGLWLLEGPLDYRKLSKDPSGPKSRPLNVDLAVFAKRSGKLHDKLYELQLGPEWRDAVAALPDVEFSPDSLVFLT